MAQMADRYAIVRSVHHKAAPIHETGHQMMQTGYLFRGGQEYPHYGGVAVAPAGPRPRRPAAVRRPAGPDRQHRRQRQPRPGRRLPRRRARAVLPARRPAAPGFQVATSRPAGIDPARLRAARRCSTPSTTPSGPSTPPRTAGRATTPTSRRSACSSPRRPRRRSTSPPRATTLRDRYGRNTFGQSCLLARRLVEGGVRLVTVNMFDTVFDEITWDCHADGGSLASTLDDYKDTLCPMFDRAYTALLDDLKQRGMLDNTLVVAMGEFGRTPQLNPRGGRDHWPGVWSVLFAGARRPRRPGDRLVRPHRRPSRRTAGHARGGGRDRLPRPGHRPGARAARPRRAAAAAGRGGADRRSCSAAERAEGMNL